MDSFFLCITYYLNHQCSLIECNGVCVCVCVHIYHKPHTVNEVEYKKISTFMKEIMGWINYFFPYFKAIYVGYSLNLLKKC